MKAGGRETAPPLKVYHNHMKLTIAMVILTAALLFRIWLWYGADADLYAFAIGMATGATLVFWVVRLCLRR
jgi:hypothetical protein